VYTTDDKIVKTNDEEAKNLNPELKHKRFKATVTTDIQVIYAMSYLT
jgi:hypothetical protein